MRWLVGRWWFWVIVVGTLTALPLVRAFLRPMPKMPPVLGAVQPFQLTRESGAPFSSTDLHTKVWVAASFGDEGRTGMKAMHELEKHMQKLAEAFELVSVAEPGTTPGTLAAWASEHKVNPRRWVALTGETQALRQSLGLASNADRLVLVDVRGRIRGIWDMVEGRLPAQLEDVMFAAELVVHEY
jgi:hypothetical protein